MFGRRNLFLLQSDAISDAIVLARYQTRERARGAEISARVGMSRIRKASGRRRAGLLASCDRLEPLDGSPGQGLEIFTLVMLVPRNAVQTGVATESRRRLCMWLPTLPGLLIPHAFDDTPYSMFGTVESTTCALNERREPAFKNSLVPSLFFYFLDFFPNSFALST